MTRDNEPTENARDPLADAMRDEAMAERPAFSVQLHRRILDRVNEDRESAAVHRIGRWRPVAAVAAIGILIGVMAGWMIHSRRAGIDQTVATEISPPSIVQPTATPQAANAFTIPVHVTRLLSAGISRPVITLQLPPLPGGQPSEPARPTSPPPMSPEWLQAGLNEPGSRARAALNEMIPPEVKVLLSFAPSPQ